jgi:16S rRNA (adenine1518-N6/adenine1519-N6)-dimethyltransferase
MTFTVQREVADRFAAAPGGEAYGPLSILTALLGRVRMGPIVPATAFWPAPTVASRILRIDFDPAAAGRVKDAAVLTTVVNLAFGQRRKQMRAMLRRSDVPFAPEALERAMAEAGIDPQERAERIRPEQYLAMATALS